MLTRWIGRRRRAEDVIKGRGWHNTLGRHGKKQDRKIRFCVLLIHVHEPCSWHGK